MKTQENAETPRTQRFTENRGRRARRARRVELTTPDLVLLSLLAERPMHGYQANLELERREIRDWANVSRPQVYYSLEKLARGGLIRSLETEVARQKQTLQSIYAEVGHKYHEAVWMVGLMLEQMRAEVRWTHQLDRELERRARALYPQFAEGLPK